MSDRGNVARFPADRARQPAIEEFTPFYASQMEGRAPKPREWMIDGVLLRRTILILAGAPKIGKSLLLQQLLTSTALGQPWLGRETVRSRSFGFFCEDPQEELERRQSDINAFYDCAAADLELDFCWSSRDGREAVLVEFERYTDKPKFTALWYQLWDFVKDEGIGIVGLDTTRAIFGGNENSPVQVTRFIREAQKKVIETDTSLIMNTHPAKGDVRGYAGTGAWLASVRAGLSLGRPSDWDEEQHGLRDPRRMLRGLGSNYGGAGIGAEPLEYQDGVFVVGEAARRSNGKRGPLNMTERTDLQYRLLIGLKRVLQNGGRVPADEMDPKSMPNRARRSTDPQINRVALNELYLAQQELIDKGQLVRVEVAHRVLLRPHDGPYYHDEIPYVAPKAPVDHATD
jgi:hypothetical protein